MADTPQIKEQRQAIQADIKDLVFGNNQRDVPEEEGNPDPQPDVVVDSSSKGEDAPENLARKSEKRFQDLVNENKALKAKQATDKGELDTLRKRAETMEPFERESRVEALVKNKPAGWDKMPAEQQVAYVSDQAAQEAVKASQLPPELLQELETSRIEREITRATGRTWDPQQMAVLTSLREEAPGLPGPDLVHVAMRRHSEIFGESGNGMDALPPSHVVNAPRADGQNPNTQTRRQRDDKSFSDAARRRDKIGMKAGMISTIKDAIFKETTPRGQRR